MLNTIITLATTASKAKGFKSESDEGKVILALAEGKLDAATAWTALVANMLNPIVAVTSPNKHVVQCDLRKVPAAVGIHFPSVAAEKMLTDISKGSTKGGTDNDVHEQRRKKVAAWYDGNLTMKGGGTPDPIGRQMKEEIIAAYRKNGADLNSAEGKEAVKGSAADILTRAYADESERKAAFEHFRALAEKTLASRATVEVKPIASIKLFDPKAAAAK